MNCLTIKGVELHPNKIDNIYVRGMIAFNGWRLIKLGYGVWIQPTDGDKVEIKQFTVADYPRAVALRNLLESITLTTTMN